MRGLNKLPPQIMSGFITPYGRFRVVLQKCIVSISGPVKEAFTPVFNQYLKLELETSLFKDQGVRKDKVFL